MPLREEGGTGDRCVGLSSVLPGLGGDPWRGEEEHVGMGVVVFVSPRCPTWKDWLLPS